MGILAAFADLVLSDILKMIESSAMILSIIAGICAAFPKVPAIDRIVWCRWRRSVRSCGRWGWRTARMPRRGRTCPSSPYGPAQLPHPLRVFSRFRVPVGGFCCLLLPGANTTARISSSCGLSLCRYRLTICVCFDQRVVGERERGGALESRSLPRHHHLCRLLLHRNRRPHLPRRPARGVGGGGQGVGRGGKFRLFKMNFEALCVVLSHFDVVFWRGRCLIGGEAGRWNRL